MPPPPILTVISGTEKPGKLPAIRWYRVITKKKEKTQCTAVSMPPLLSMRVFKHPSSLKSHSPIISYIILKLYYLFLSL